MKNNKKILKQYARQYIAELYEPALREAGFACPNDDLLCWYRLQSDEIVNSFTFYTSWSCLPVLLSLEYGIVPLFEMPFHMHGITCNKMIDNVLLTNPVPGRIEGSKTIFIEGIPVQVSHGSRILEVLLPEMDRIHTIEEAHNYHKNRILSYQEPEYNATQGYGKYGPLSRTMINMALWVDDEEMYPDAVRTVDKKVDYYERICKKRPDKTEYPKELATWQRLQEVLRDGKRDDYIAELTRRMEKNTRLVKERYLGQK